MDANLWSLIAAARAAGDGSVQLVIAQPDIAILDEGGRVAGWARALAARGARPGDRIVVQAEKSVDNALLYLASLRAGLIYVPLNTAYTAAELDYFIGDAGPARRLAR